MNHIFIKGVKPFSQIFRPFQIERFADDNLFLIKNDGKFSKSVGNTVGKGEIARYEQFLLFRQCFKSFVLQTIGRGLKHLYESWYHTTPSYWLNCILRRF